MNLKKILCGVLFGAFIIAGSTAHAQVLPKFGVKAGLNYATFNNTDNAEYKTGFLGGVYVNINIPATPVAIQPEVLYAQYGSNFENTEAKYSLDYIQIPVLAKFGFGAPAVPVKPEVFFGPYAGFNINSEFDDGSGSANADDLFEGTDFGVVVGAGVSISRLSLEFRYTAGLTNVISESTQEDGQKNGAFALTAGIHF